MQNPAGNAKSVTFLHIVAKWDSAGRDDPLLILYGTSKVSPWERGVSKASRPVPAVPGCVISLIDGPGVKNSKNRNCEVMPLVYPWGSLDGQAHRIAVTQASRGGGDGLASRFLPASPDCQSLL